MLHNSNCDKTQNFKLWQRLKTQIVTTLKNSKCDKIQRLKLWQNSKTLFLIKQKKSNSDKTKKNSSPEKTQFLTKSLLVRTTRHLENGWDVLGAVVCDLAMFYFCIS